MYFFVELLIKDIFETKREKIYRLSHALLKFTVISNFVLDNMAIKIYKMNGHILQTSYAYMVL